MVRSLLAVLLLSLAMAPASAWGPRGHRLVAELADAGLTPSARAEVQALLRDESEPTLAGVANWADALRSEDPDLGRASAPWHYVNLGESGCSYVAARDCPDGACVVEAIVDQTAILADRARPPEERLQALKFVVHFVGDVHQPMHAGYARDKGGNTVQVNLPDGSRDGRGSNLHALWDSGLFDSRHESQSRQLARLRALPAATATAGAGVDPARWAEESCRIVRRPGVYPARATLDPAYYRTWRPVAERQLVLGGRRLAMLLNQALDD
ncbi:S1/P1 nuclease [Luteimonas sp. SJ-92]|uniref:S1/P1 nuclease n=1 Tax=Luteimonas salinisoli TaxID=2752307 RepID=A0A853JFT0_9GAMM|nr:S1/P1 nuclease [Luteimonas salinisoli]NZA28231.1 S1/P1 nuclease [Luteimonas salinisoli]